MRRAVLSTFFFAAILGLGCMGVTVPVKADTDRFDGHWMGTGTVVRKDPYFPSAYGAKFEYLGTLARGRWEYKAESTYENWGCGGTYVAQSSK